MIRFIKKKLFHPKKGQIIKNENYYYRAGEYKNTHPHMYQAQGPNREQGHVRGQTLGVTKAHSCRRKKAVLIVTVQEAMPRTNPSLINQGRGTKKCFTDKDNLLDHFI